MVPAPVFLPIYNLLISGAPGCLQPARKLNGSSPLLGLLVSGSSSAKEALRSPKRNMCCGYKEKKNLQVTANRDRKGLLVHRDFVVSF